ncbi:hypothetical protein EDB80DRAFT_601912 [Ilyonectria destructans]|nr:hypothetical protein EDB80DRAFT_601912 [Ilyonectria destructans]
MADLNTFLCPLDGVNDARFQTLCRILWGWTSCTACSTAKPCEGQECPQRRLLRLGPFFRYYEEVAGSYVPESFMPDAPRALRGHEDLFEIIELLQERPSAPRSELSTSHFAIRSNENGELPSLDDQHRAFNLAMRVLLMVSCCVENQSGGLLESGREPCVWRSDQSAADFTTSTFPFREHPSLDGGCESPIDIKSELSAIKLKRIAGLKIQGTTELRDHLRLDQKTGILEIYHLTSVLREHLRSSVLEEPSETGSTSREIIPRQLALETLQSLRILFPLDSDSQSLLRSLVSKELFDPDCLRFGTTLYQRQNESETSYWFWGSRLMDLFDEIENPKPRSLLEVWMDKRSKARHVMMATLVGVIIAVLLGIFGLAVGIFQAWVAYEAWKHPG